MSRSWQKAENYEIDSVPIPEKIFRLMRKCNCAIISLNSP